jgi:hypothetical protein
LCGGQRGVLRKGLAVFIQFLVHVSYSDSSKNSVLYNRVQ